MDIFSITPEQEAPEDPGMDKIVAYQLAHMEWIK